MNRPEEEKERTLLDIAEALADGMPVDWPGLRTGEPAIGDQIGRLEELSAVVRAYRDLREAGAEGEAAPPEAGPGVAGDTGPATPAASDDT